MTEYYLTREDIAKKYGVPEQKKFPLPDAGHVRSAIKFFNYVDPKYERQLAKAILQRAKEYGVDISEMSIGDNNRFKKYLPKQELYHYGILGQKWGIRRFENPDGTLTEAGKARYGKGEKGQKNFSKDFKRMYKKSDRTNNDFKNRVTNKVGSLVSKEEVEMLAVKREKAFKLFDKVDRLEDELYNKASKQAYKEAFDWMEKNDPDYLNEIIKRNNGDKYGLDSFHDFRKVYEGYEDSIYTTLSKDFNKKHPEIKEADDVWRDYMNSCKEVTNNLLGKYGDRTVNGKALSDILFDAVDINKLLSMYPEHKR